MNASGCARPGEDVGRLKASWVDVMALREEVRLLLLEKRLASQLIVDVVGQDGNSRQQRWIPVEEASDPKPVQWSQKNRAWAKR